MKPGISSTSRNDYSELDDAQSEEKDEASRTSKCFIDITDAADYWKWTRDEVLVDTMGRERSLAGPIQYCRFEKIASI